MSSPRRCAKNVLDETAAQALGYGDCSSDGVAETIGAGTTRSIPEAFEVAGSGHVSRCGAAAVAGNGGECGEYRRFLWRGRRNGFTVGTVGSRLMRYL